MIQVEIPKDVRQYETKLLGPLTLRQSLWGGLGVGLCLLFYNKVGKPLQLSSDMLFLACAIIAFIPILFGFAKPYGMPFEKFAKVAFWSLIAPSHRVYKTKNIYDPEQKNIEKTKDNKKTISKKVLKEHPEYISYK